jgi:hypothetical protein
MISLENLEKNTLNIEPMSTQIETYDSTNKDFRGFFLKSWSVIGLNVFSALSIGVTAFCVLSVNGVASLLSVNSLISILSVNSAFSILSANSAFSVGCANKNFSICFNS